MAFNSQITIAQAILYDALGNPLLSASGHPAGTELGLITRDIERVLPCFYAVFSRIAPGANKYMATLFNTSATRRVVIQRIWNYNWQFTGVTDALLEQELRRITARTAGTPVTPYSADPSDALSAGITADHASTAVADSTLLQMLVTGQAESTIAGGEAGLKVFRTAAYGALVYERKPGLKGHTLLQDQGITVKNLTASVLGSCSYVFEFTDEPA